MYKTIVKSYTGISIEYLFNLKVHLTVQIENEQRVFLNKTFFKTKLDRFSVKIIFSTNPWSKIKTVLPATSWPTVPLFSLAYIFCSSHAEGGGGILEPNYFVHNKLYIYMGSSDPEFQVPSCHSFFLAVDKSLAGRNLWRVAKNSPRQLGPSSLKKMTIMIIL